MLGRIIVVCLVLASARVAAAPALEIHATCAAELARDPAHVRTLRGELARALAGTRAIDGYKLDVSLVRLAAQRSGRELEVRAEVRALLSDAQGRVQWSSTSRAIARGTPRDRSLLERDAVAAAAHELATQVRASSRGRVRSRSAASVLRPARALRAGDGSCCVRARSSPA